MTGGEEVARRNIVTVSAVEKKGISDVYCDLLGILLMKS